MADINKKLETLYALLVDNLDVLEAELKTLIENPERIENTNKFASLLSVLKNSIFINPLLETISKSDRHSSWLADFLYAVINLLDESSVNDKFEIPENLIDKLEAWILNYKDEISWKSASLLKFYDSTRAEQIQLKKLEERDDFFMTYIECLLGLLRFNESKHWPLVQQIAEDDTYDDDFRAFANKLMLNNQSY